jgi:hypothetical protein
MARTAGLSWAQNLAAGDQSEGLKVGIARPKKGKTFNDF